MKLKFLSILLLSFTLTACEVPTSDNNSRVVGDGEYQDGFGSEFAGMPESELAPGVYDTVYFATDSSVLNSDARVVLSAQAGWLKDNPAINVVIEGHCDERATREYNLALGERRADAVKRFLISSGVSASRVSTISYGKERPVALGSFAEAWAQNRRGVTVVR